MSTTINHGQLAKVDENGNIDVFYPKTFSKDVYVNDEKTTLETFLGTTSISTIGDGTISGAISAINDQYDQINSKVNWRTGGSAVNTFIRSGDDTTTNFAHVSGGKDGGAPFLSTGVVTNGSVTDGITISKDLQGLKVSGLVNGVDETINLSAISTSFSWMCPNSPLDPGPLFTYMKNNCPYLNTTVSGKCWFGGHAAFQLVVYSGRVVACVHIVSPIGIYMYAYNDGTGTGDHVYVYGQKDMSDISASLGNAWTSINNLSSRIDGCVPRASYGSEQIYSYGDGVNRMRKPITDYNMLYMEYLFNNTICTQYKKPDIMIGTYTGMTYRHPAYPGTGSHEVSIGLYWNDSVNFTPYVYSDHGDYGAMLYRVVGIISFSGW